MNICRNLTRFEKRKLLVDARCLQLPPHLQRGIGLHAVNLLAGAPRDGGFEIIGLIDPGLAPLPAEIDALFDRLTTSLYDVSVTENAVFLAASPMTHDMRPLARILRNNNIYKTALVFDFIPLDWPDLYLRDPRTRRNYYGALAALRRFDGYFPISQATGARLRAFHHNARIIEVTGVAVRPALLPKSAPVADFIHRQDIMVVAGDDPRKNPDIAVLAHGASSILQKSGIKLVIAGVQDRQMRQMLIAHHKAAGGNQALLEFLPFISDDALAGRYREAKLLIAPSRAEGFSMPIIEALANGCAVLASNDPAQAELITDPKLRFDPDDAPGLTRAMERICLDEAAFKAAISAAPALAAQFTPDAVAAHFWNGLQRALTMPSPTSPFVSRRARPRIGFLSPMPPSLSGCADYSHATLAALAPLCDVTVFSSTPEPVLPPGIAFGGDAGMARIQTARFDAFVSVIGNSRLHDAEYDFLRAHGAATILHDARLINYMLHRFGMNRTRALAQTELARPVSAGEIESWSTDQRRLPCLFLGEIVGAAAPLFVHSTSMRKAIGGLYGIDARYLPFAPYRLLADDALSKPARLAARRRLGVPEGELVIASFGHVALDRQPARLVEMVRHLRTSGMAASLYLIGPADAPLRAQLAQVDFVWFSADALSDTIYRDWLAAADLAVQLRLGPVGSISGALMDCLAAGLPTIAGRMLADAIGGPMAHVVDDEPDPAHLADMAANILAGGGARDMAERDAFVRARSMTSYATQLLQQLGYEVLHHADH